MYAELFEYLLQNKKLSVPGIGTFLLERKPARIDFPARLAHPPVFSFSLQPGSGSPSRLFFNWLASVLKISDREAIIRFNDFVFDMKRELSEDGLIEWKGVGELSRALNGDIAFSPAQGRSFGEPVTAVKVLRENAAHSVRVGEEEKTSLEMVEMLGSAGEKKSFWWAGGLVLGLLAVLFLGWHFSENGLGTGSTANQKKLQVPGGSSTYTQVP